jgi:hypothetical protein
VQGFDPRLFRTLARGLAAGVAAGMAMLTGLLATDVGGLAGIALGGRHGWLPLAMLGWAFAITFGSAGMGIAIHRLGRADAPRHAPEVARGRAAMLSMLGPESGSDHDRGAQAGA